MTLAARLTRQPIAHDPDAGADATRAFADLGPEVSGLIGGAAGCYAQLGRGEGCPRMRQRMISQAD